MLKLECSEEQDYLKLKNLIKKTWVSIASNIRIHISNEELT